MVGEKIEDESSEDADDSVKTRKPIGGCSSYDDLQTIWLVQIVLAFLAPYTFG